MFERQTQQHQQVIEVGGPGGVRVSSITPTPNNGSLAPRGEPSTGLRLAAAHPRLLAGGLVFVGLAVLFGPLVLISTIGLPAWLVIGPVLLSIIAFGGAFAVARGSLAALGSSAHEQRIIDLAARFGGRLTVGLTAQQLSISLREAEDALMALVRTGHVDIDDDPDSAAVIYVFRDLSPLRLR